MISGMVGGGYNTGGPGSPKGEDGGISSIKPQQSAKGTKKSSICSAAHLQGFDHKNNTNNNLGDMMILGGSFKKGRNNL